MVFSKKFTNVWLEHPQQMWDMCQMLNIWHISHTKPNLSPFSRCGIWYFFCNIEQYRDKFATVRKRCGIKFIVCLFLSLSFLLQSPLSLTPILSSPLSLTHADANADADADDHFHANVDTDLSLAMVFLFFFFFFLLWFDGFGSNGGGWVRMG